jgi:hypothetical protein
MNSLRILAIVLSLSAAASADTVTLPNIDDTNYGGQTSAAIFGPAGITFQWMFDPTEVAGIPVGSSITAIGFRLDANDVDGPSVPVTIPNWDLQLSSSPNTFDALSATFSGNIGPNAVTVRSGSLTVPVNALTFDGGNVPFYYVDFSTPYVFDGSNILFTLTRDADPAGTALWVDAEFPTTPASDGNTVRGGETSTRGTVNFFSFPVTSLEYTQPTPEPSSWLLLVSGLGIGVIVARRRQSA